MDYFENIETEMTMYFAKEILLSLRADKSNYLYIFDIGKKRYNDVIDFLIENNEISHDEQNELEKIKAIYSFDTSEVVLMESMKLEIVEGKTHWQELNIQLLEKMISFQLVKEEDAIRYLAHRNNYHEVISWSDNKKELFQIAQKYS